MLATAITLAVIGFAVTGLADLMRKDGAKIAAALRGRSWAAGQTPTRQMVIRFNSPHRAAEQVLLRPVLRAAA